MMSPIGGSEADQIFDFCCDSELFGENLHNSEVASSSNCCPDDEIAAAVSGHIAAVNDEIKQPEQMVFSDGPIENDISASIDFTTSPYFDPSSNFPLENENMMSSGGGGGGGSGWCSGFVPQSSAMVSLLEPLLEDPYFRQRNSQQACPLMDPMMGQQYLNTPQFHSSETAENFPCGFLGTDFSNPEVEFHGDNGGFFLSDTLPRIFNCSNELQTLSGEGQLLIHGAASTNPLGSDISNLEDSTFKVGKISAEERKRKIHRYLKKRNERNFSKKIKYACRKTLADSRPRVRGRFAKNDELGELARTNPEDDTDEDVSVLSNSTLNQQQTKVVNDDDELDSAAEIFARLNGITGGFKCSNYPIKSWI